VSHTLFNIVNQIYNPLSNLGCLVEGGLVSHLGVNHWAIPYSRGSLSSQEALLRGLYIGFKEFVSNLFPNITQSETYVS